MDALAMESATEVGAALPAMLEADGKRIPTRGPLLLGAAVPESSTSHDRTRLARSIADCRPDLALFSGGAGAGALATLSGDHGLRTLSNERQAAAWLGGGRAVLMVRGEEDGTEAHELLGLMDDLPDGANVVAGRATDTDVRQGALSLRISNALSPRTVERYRGDGAWRRLLAWHDCALTARSTKPSARAADGGEPLAAAVAPEVLDGEIRSLPDGARLVDGGEYLVAAARADDAPNVLRELGRLRELTFRAAGEGTGRPTDVDSFDDCYTHLFVWNKAARAVAGAYRIGETDRLLARGPSALYTSTLFDFDPELFDRLGPALELGRSFVTPEYQRSSRTLLLLWKGIGAFVARRRKYRHLFGPVSVSADYTTFSRHLIESVLGGDHHRHPLAPLVRARTPAERRHFGDGGLGDPSAVLADPVELSSVVSSAEPDAKGLPVLVSEYLKLGGRFLGFNVDAAFSSVLDGLVAVDLARTDPRLLGFYMGKETAAAFLSGVPASPAEG